MSDWKIEETAIGNGAFVLSTKAPATERAAIREDVALFAKRIWDKPEGRAAIARAGELRAERAKKVAALKAKRSARVRLKKL